jgi:16S rRNA (guanine527-N7)-methyltransferase
MDDEATTTDEQAADAFARALAAQAHAYGGALTADARARLTAYFLLVRRWTPRLHLVAPCAPAEFATRHVLESLCALPHVAPGAHVLDVGSGAGLPLIPCLLARADLRGTLVEASAKKAIFLRAALGQLALRERATVHAARFEQTNAPPADYLTCRALERFTQTLPRLVRWSPARTLLLFGGPTLREKIEELGLSYQAELLPKSEQRFLFVVNKAG